MAPKTVQEVAGRLKVIYEQSPDTFTFFNGVSDMMAEICSESLDPNKVVGTVGYDGSPLIDEWAYQEGKYPFHIKDNITGEQVTDPRVMLVGKFLVEHGNLYYQDDMASMREVYIRTAQRIHTRIRPLDYAWSGIGSWLA
mgnify:CR=1 FL=1